MQTRMLGRLWPVSALTLGGGGLGQVWGSTTREEAVATVREAVASGITLLDLAPIYGNNGEAESVIGEAFEGRLPAGVRVTTKHLLGNPPAAEVYDHLAASLDGSLERLRLKRVDVFILHGMVDSSAPPGAASRTSLALYRESVVSAFERLVREGRVGAWGITAFGVPETVIAAIEHDPSPGVAQCIANLLDSAGGMKRWEGPSRPRDVIRAASQRGVGVMGIRAVQAGALTSAIDRDLPPGNPESMDFRRAAPFRAIAAEVGEAPASLAHRYALSMEGVDTVVLGVKNREELRECLAAEATGPLDPTLIARIDAAVGREGLAGN